MVCVYEQRCQIFACKETKISQRIIAERVGVSQSTVSRELSRYQDENHLYRPDKAHDLSRKKRDQRKGKFFVLTRQHIDFIENKICLDQWSPEQICGHLWLKENIKISPQTVYNFMTHDRKNGGKLYQCLRRKGKRYRYQKGKEQKILANRVDLSKRPLVIDEKSRVGDWELDSIVGAGHQEGLTTMVERKTGFTKAVLQKALKAKSTKEGIIVSLNPLKEHVLTLTSDNGTEFFHHQEIAKVLEADFYFAKPYSP